MSQLPEILVRLIHIKGPLKGTIQEFTSARIGIGRHPDNSVCFPADLDIVSRNHADIVREGNRFRLIDHSTNGTYVGNRRVSEAYLRDGDVLSIADLDTGPKISFLTEVLEEQGVAPRRPPVLPEEPLQGALRGAGAPVPPMPAPNDEQPVAARLPVPLAIQFGPTLRSFKAVPVTIGKGPGVDFALDHPQVAARHAQIFFFQDAYWIEDLTGANQVRLNGRAIGRRSALAADDLLALSDQGPTFRFLGGGRLVEDS